MKQKGQKELINQAKSILKLDEIDLENKRINYNNKDYKIREWFGYTSHFILIDKNQIRIRNNEKELRSDIIYHTFLVNVFKTTKNGGILPLIVFFLFSLITFSLPLIFRLNENFGLEPFSKENTTYIYFLAIFLLFLSLFLFVKIVVLKYRIFYGIKGGQFRYIFISFTDYQKIIQKLEEKIKNSPIFFNKIYGESYSIREFNIFDAENVLKYASDDAVLRYLNTDKIKNLDEAYAYIIGVLNNYKNGSISKLAIIDNTSNIVIGYIGNVEKSDFGCECSIVYALNKDYWHKGIMTSVLKMYINYLKSIKKTKVSATIMIDNEASKRVLEKCGFKNNELLNKNIVINNEIVELLVYELYFDDNSLNNDLKE